MTRLWWLSVAPLGYLVVPLVYWMFTGSCADIVWWRAASSAGRTPTPASSMSSQSWCRGTRRVRRRAVARGSFGDHRGVVARLEPLCRDQDAARGLGDGVDERLGAVGRVEVDEDRPDRRSSELDVDPFDVVRGLHIPTRSPGWTPRVSSPAGDPVDLFGELAVGEPDVLERSDQRIAGPAWVATTRSNIARIVSASSGTRRVEQRAPGWSPSSPFGSVGRPSGWGSTIEGCEPGSAWTLQEEGRRRDGVPPAVQGVVSTVD